ncbi:alpha-L-fucosidase [Alistipes sp.]|uniref:alpha-L-fucosidase n=1 Tax=Alistipes sp. TaxID=1872444 RepID=UPI000E8DE75B|nr:alpha-L-fucosidase [Alistipes sp.]HBX90681.1 alpha-1,3/4-fucosidase [Alistipes sp.]HCN14401.1 alpha-1,3/4-fucosidase [Alistipes sp.]
MKRTLTALLLAAVTVACEQYHVKQAALPADATPEERAAIAGRVVPTPQQLAWQQLELTAFLHFGINTFTGREWGDGQEDPALFDPSDLDVDQWVRTLRDAGFKLVILTAKHHDGFCLWPTATTSHSVASSPWRGGKGDVLGELHEACRKYGMRFGVYLSPWDRNAPSYGDSPRYNDLFDAQLTELLTRYGKVDEVWFDGACGEGPNGRKQEYDWERIYATIERLQPEAVTAIMGQDVRWVGNEGGLGRTTEWSATALAPGGSAASAASNEQLGLTAMTQDLGGRDILSRATAVYWWPSEVDVSIRPGWFYHQSEDAQVKSLRHLVDIYYSSVGRNSQLLLNIPPDRRGRIAAADSVRLRELADYLDRTFADDRIEGGAKLFRAEAGQSREYDLKPQSRINTVLLQEDIARGQRVEAFTVEALIDGAWTEVGRGTTIGYKRLLRIPEVEASKLRITVDGTRLRCRISRVGAYLAPSLVETAATADDGLLPRDAWSVRRAMPLTVDLGEPRMIAGFVYAPGEASERVAYKYRFEVSADGDTWTEAVADGEFSNMMYNAEPRRVTFDKPLPVRCFRLTATTVAGTPAEVEMQHIGLFGNE